MQENLELSFLTTLIQAIGIMLVAGLLWPMTRALPGRSLRYWSFGWLALTLALFSLYASFRVEQPFGTLLLIGYCEAEYLFGFLLWAGCREVATRQPLRPRQFAVLVPLAAFGAVTPAALHDIRHAFPFHAAVMGVLFLLALFALRNVAANAHTPTTGLWVLRGALAGLALCFLHYAIVTGYLVYFQPGVVYTYMLLSSVYDMLLETCLAFGMVMLATDRMRGEITEKNAQLAAAAAELAVTARTDALTGLLNRRALNDLMSDPAPTGASGGVAMLDMNDLKPLNDRHGHEAGDVALQLIARSLRIHFRVTDPIFRLGGDEFAVVMPGCAEGDLAARLGLIDAALAGQRIPGLREPVDLRIAWGVATYAAPGDLTEAIRKADLAMYACKRDRKNRVPAATPHDPGSMGGL